MTSIWTLSVSIWSRPYLSTISCSVNKDHIFSWPLSYKGWCKYVGTNCHKAVMHLFTQFLVQELYHFDMHFWSFANWQKSNAGSIWGFLWKEPTKTLCMYAKFGFFSLHVLYCTLQMAKQRLKMFPFYGLELLTSILDHLSRYKGLQLGYLR